jgi:hypothetical protein
VVLGVALGVAVTVVGTDRVVGGTAARERAGGAPNAAVTAMAAARTTTVDAAAASGAGTRPARTRITRKSRGTAGV